ncbi:MAG: hypothetical protein D6687_11890 [Acidobacteria bacterium]|jgi:rubrerythrin|nr:MAG: hypothetical protein D6687_11890 [Acidobacteriota bacterium]
MMKIELKDFYNEGFGWICKRCEEKLKDESSKTSGKSNTLSRLMSEGEAESKMPELSSKALAKWADSSRKVLVCPRCGVTEIADKS